MLRCVLDVDRLTELVTGADEEAQFKFEIEGLGLAVGGRRLTSGANELTARSAKVSTGDDNRGSATVIADGEPSPVGLERVLAASEHDTHVERVVLRSVKVGVVSNVSRQEHLDARLSNQSLGLDLFIRREALVLSIEQQQALDDAACLGPGLASCGHECVEASLLE